MFHNIIGLSIDISIAPNGLLGCQKADKDDSLVSSLRFWIDGRNDH